MKKKKMGTTERSRSGMKQRSERNERLEHELEIGDEPESASFEAYLWFVFSLCVLSLKLEASLMPLVLLMPSSPNFFFPH